MIGTCDGRGCGIEIRRGDKFVTPLSGHLVCRPCWETDDWLAPPIDEPEDYGPDNPYF